MDKKTLEKYSSAFTLSDMEIYIFPELFYSLVLSNIMSPIVWEWKDDPWFKDFDKKTTNYKINRLKQFIINKYVFNLDLDTWGLTDKTKETDRFKDFIDLEALKRSNALFGYEGDKYYFDIDIRRHFGLDKYNSEKIPYWKTETIEAMTAFKYKEGYNTGAGECVSLSTLYAAALFIIAKIPLEKIFLMATPLHSQNYIIEGEGVITNNRRIVTKNMWFNGTILSQKARRAIEKERITIVSHISGYIHKYYEDATIDLDSYNTYSESISKYLHTYISPTVFSNFLRAYSKYQKYFQFKQKRNNREGYITLEKVFEYEHSSKYSFSENSRQALIKEIYDEDFQYTKIDKRIVLNELEDLLKHNKKVDTKVLKEHMCEVHIPEDCKSLKPMFKDLKEFIYTKPDLPEKNKTIVKQASLNITTDNTREEIFEEIRSKRTENITADLALYAYRSMDEIDWQPFIKASTERNPVCTDETKGKSINEVYDFLKEMDNESIYDSNRLALPDEAWNFKRGDGVEKAFILINVLLSNDSKGIVLDINGSDVKVIVGGDVYEFVSGKGIVNKVKVN